MPNPLKKNYRCSNRDKIILHVVRKVSDSYKPCNLIGPYQPLFGNKPKKFGFGHQTVSRRELSARRLGTRLKIGAEKLILELNWAATLLVCCHMIPCENPIG